MKPGDRVLVSCITACGACRFCREGRYGQCLGGGGWILGHLIDGTQAEYVRVPFADTSTYPVPAGVERRADPDARRHPADRLRGRRAQRRTSQPGDVVAIVGAGPIGLSAIMGARLLQPEPRRRDRPAPTAGSRRPSGSAPTSSSTTHARTLTRSSRELTGGLGADVAIEAVGVPADVRARGAARSPRRPHRQHRRARQAGDPASRRAVDHGRHDHHRPRRHVLDADAPAPAPGHQLDAGRFVTHHFGLDQFKEAYDVFARGRDRRAQSRVDAGG